MFLDVFLLPLLLCAMCMDDLLNKTWVLGNRQEEEALSCPGNSPCFNALLPPNNLFFVDRNHLVVYLHIRWRKL